MVKLASALSRLNPIKALVIGDFMLDAYTIGKAKRISPEAPVAVVHVQQESYRPGGAGNVALNLISLGAQVVSIGRLGNDWAGAKLVQTLQDEKIHTDFLIQQEAYQTPVKNRIIAENQQIVRIDHEQLSHLPESIEQLIIDALPNLLKNVNVVALSDYGKGFLTPTLLQVLFKEACRLNIPVITDPKGQDFTKYQGTTVIKPNLMEAYAAANMPLQASLETVAQKILQMTQAELLMITRSEAGLSLFDAQGKQMNFPVQVRQVKDVTGAGDTVLAMLTCAIANQLSHAEAAHLCNIAAGLAIEQLGCARITLNDLAHRLLERDVNNKVFDEEHLFALQEVLKQHSFNLLALSSKTSFSPSLFREIKQLAQPQTHLLIYLNDVELEDIFIEMLASLKEVDFIVVHSESLRRICETVHPLKTYLFDNESIKSILHFSVLLEASPNYK